MIAVVIVSWNTADLLADCLRTLPSGASEPLDVIVVDNASADDSAARARSLGARVFVNDANVGYARANNQGWRVADSQADVVVLLNSDTLVPADALGQLANAVRADDRCGACGPQLRLPDGRSQPFGFGGDPTPAYLMLRTWRRLLGRSMHDWGDRTAREVDWSSGACLALRREALERVDGLDEQFFMYFEDVDLCRRVRRAGWHVRRLPETVVTHIGGQSLRQNPAARQAYGRSLRLFYRKHFGAPARLWLTLALPLYQRALA